MESVPSGTHVSSRYCNQFQGLRLVPRTEISYKYCSTGNSTDNRFKVLKHGSGTNINWHGIIVS